MLVELSLHQANKWRAFCCVRLILQLLLLHGAEQHALPFSNCWGPQQASNTSGSKLTTNYSNTWTDYVILTDYTIVHKVKSRAQKKWKYKALSIGRQLLAPPPTSYLHSNHLDLEFDGCWVEFWFAEVMFTFLDTKIFLLAPKDSICSQADEPELQAQGH